MFRKILLALTLAACVRLPVHAGPPPVLYANVPYGTDPAQVMDIYVPPDGIYHPGVIMIHGGGWSGGDKEDLTSIARSLSGFGYIVANINYRLDTPTTNQYPAAVDDCISATNWLRRNADSYDVDRRHISSFGTSAGASMALTLGNSDEVESVVSFYAPSNFTDPAFLSDYLNGVSNVAIMENYLGYTYTQDPLLYQTASPFFNISASSAPTIFFHGLDDTTVPSEQSVLYYNSLVALDINAEIHLEPGLGHGFLTEPDYDPTVVLEQSVAFLKANMR